MQKKSQAAFEFLMTYGWAILIIISAIGALNYYGVFNGTDYLKEECFVTNELRCIDFGHSNQAGNPTFQIELANHFNRNIKIKEIRIYHKDTLIGSDNAGWQINKNLQEQINIVTSKVPVSKNRLKIEVDLVRNDGVVNPVEHTIRGYAFLQYNE
jgi:hypothetical protein